LNESAYEKKYYGLELPLGPAPVCGLKSLLCKEGRLVVPLAVSFCFFLRADANSGRWGAFYAPRALPGPSEGQVAISPIWQLYRQLNNPSPKFPDRLAQVTRLAHLELSS
jgi:hypothetical protein